MNVVYPAPPLIPDAERIVSAWLRASDAVAAIAGDRVYTVFPSQQPRELPLVLVQRVAGVPAFPQPLLLDEAYLQIDAYGGPKRTAYLLAATVRAALCTLQDTEHDEGRVTAVAFGPLRWIPDDVYTPARARYVLDAQVFVRAAVAPAAATVPLARGEEVTAHGTTA